METNELILNQLKEMEAYAQEHYVPIMQQEGIVFLQGLIQEKHCREILEIGCAIGYSAIQMARMDENIHVVTIERDESCIQEARNNIRKCGMENQIELIEGDALNIEVPGCFDLIFIDAAKAQYIKFFEKYKQHLKPNGIIVSDNLKFHGLVEHPELIQKRNKRALVRKIKQYIDFLQHNEEYETVFYDLGDGVSLSKKRNGMDG